VIAHLPVSKKEVFPTDLYFELYIGPTQYLVARSHRPASPGKAATPNGKSGEDVFGWLFFHELNSHFLTRINAPAQRLAYPCFTK